MMDKFIEKMRKQKEDARKEEKLITKKDERVSKQVGNVPVSKG